MMIVDEVAAWLRCSPATIYRMLYRHKIPALKVGDTWRFDPELLDQWLREQQ